jgi:hypothetical protein
MLTDLEPGSDPRLAAVFSAAKAPAELPVVGEAAALTAYRKFDGKSWLRIRLGARPAQIVAAALFGGFVVAGGAAAAAAGSLPIVGGHHTHANQVQTPAPAGTSDGTDETSSATDLTDTGGPGTDGHPATLGSVQKGIDTCTAASSGTCQAGQHGKALTAHSAHTPPALPSAATTHRSGHAPATGTAATVHRPHLASAHVSFARLRTPHAGW